MNAHRMTGDGMVLTLSTGQETVIGTGERGRLKNGLHGVAHSWGHVGVIVHVDWVDRPTHDEMSLAAYDCGDGDIEDVLEKCKKA